LSLDGYATLKSMRSLTILPSLRVSGSALDLKGLRLRNVGVVRGEMVACDATFIKAYSKRDLKDHSRGYSDREARVGRAGKGYQLGYKLHLAVDASSELPLACKVAPANENKRKREIACPKN